MSVQQYALGMKIRRKARNTRDCIEIEKKIRIKYTVSLLVNKFRLKVFEKMREN